MCVANECGAAAVLCLAVFDKERPWVWCVAASEAEMSKVVAIESRGNRRRSGNLCLHLISTKE